MNTIIVTVGCNILLTPLDKSGYLKRQVILKENYKTTLHSSSSHLESRCMVTPLVQPKPS